MKITPTNARVPRTISVRKKLKYIEIVASDNPRLNALSRESQLSVAKVLRKHYAKVEITIIDTVKDLENLVSKKPDLVILGMKLILLEPAKGYDASPKIWLSHYLMTHNINFTGSNTDALKLEYIKHDSKQRVLDSGLASSAYFISPHTKPVFKHTLTYPLFVKPSNRGDSKGIDENSIVHNQQQLQDKILSIHKDCQSDALIEEYLPGREFSVAVIRKPRSSDLVAMPIEIIAPTDSLGNKFLSESVKLADSEQVIAVQEIALQDLIKQAAIGAFIALGSRDYGRMDMRLNNEGIPFFIEANLMPGLSEHGYLARCFMLYLHISYQEMILSIIGLALERSTPINKSLPDIPKTEELLRTTNSVAAHNRHTSL
jgi:D-alanine-D-alanine ligase